VGGAAAAEVLPFPRRAPRARWLPSAKSIAVGAAVAAVAGGAYVIARETSVFALRTIQVEGAPPALEAQVREALQPLVGRSLVTFDSGRARRLLFSVPQVAGASFDRDFPHTLRVFVRAETPVAVLRQATDAWLVAASGRVLARLDRRPYPALPRVWMPRSVALSVNATVGDHAAQEVQALAAARSARLGQPVREATWGASGLTLVLSSGTELRLGDAGDARLKLAVARRILPLVGPAEYVDVSVPERAVSFSNSQVGG
jgi:cell division septal protein FtsQ